MRAIKTGRGFLTALFAAALVVVVVPAFGDQASVDFGSTIRPLTHAASGFLHSMTATVPNNNLIAPLKPQVFRESPGPDPFTLYGLAAEHGADYQFVISDVYNYAQIFNQG